MDCPVNKETLDEFYDSYIVLSLSNHQLKAPFLRCVQRCKEIISAYKVAFPCDCAQLDLLLWLRTHNLISIKDCLVAMSEVVKYMYDHFVRKEFGKRKIGEIKYSDVLYFYYHLLNEKNLQLNTLETIHTVLHPTFQLAVRDAIIRINPSDGVMAQVKKKPGKNHGVRHALTLEQQRAFMEYTRNNPLYCHWAPLFTVLLGTGGRIGEIIGLRWQDLDFENRSISINHSVVYYPLEGAKKRTSVLQVSLPKTEAGIRVIPMMDTVYEALQEEYEAQKENGFNCTEIDGMTGFVFCNRFGNVHNPQTINRTIRRISENYNAEEMLNAKKERRQPVILPHFSCHHLRHTFCTRFCEQETNIKVIQSIMGHANIETTMDIYAEVTDTKKWNQ